MVDIKSILPENYRKIALVGSYILIVILLIGVAFVYLLNESKYVLYTDKFYKLQIKHPRNWKVMPDYGGTVVTLVSPPDIESDTFTENLNITVTEIPSHIKSFEEFSKITTGQMELVFGKNIEVKESKEIIFHDMPAYSYVVQTVEFPVQYIRFVWFFRDNRSYIITAISEDFRYRKYSKIFNHMLNSFSFEAQ